jgi:thiamine pyrophosphokinase
MYICVGVTEDNLINILDTEDKAINSCTPTEVVGFIVDSGLTIQGVTYEAEKATLKVVVQKVD